MPFLPLRTITLPVAAVAAYDLWLDAIAAELSDPACDRYALCRRILTEIYYPDLVATDPDRLPASARIALLQMDPHNITLEPEYYSDIDAERFAAVKPLIWLWEMFDRSVFGENVELGIRFRRVLAPHIFRRCGRNFKCFQYVKLSYGYNLEVGDNVVVHRYVLLDDRGGITLEDGVSIADYANIYSHTHALDDQRIVEMPRTVLGRGVRVTYHATVLAGVHMADDSMLGAMAVATKDIASGDVALGIPAEPKLRKRAASERPPHPGTPDPLSEE
jgi:acetyltransferase-like isoleucine patch superfamily enzyme